MLAAKQPLAPHGLCRQHKDQPQCQAIECRPHSIQISGEAQNRIPTYGGQCKRWWVVWEGGFRRCKSQAVELAQLLTHPFATI
jgi:hypothetical protein